MISKGLESENQDHPSVTLHCVRKHICAFTVPPLNAYAIFGMKPPAQWTNNDIKMSPSVDNDGISVSHSHDSLA